MAASAGAAGCGSKSYPADKLTESLIRICRTEYGIQDIHVKMVGQTLGVYLPLKKLFETDFKEIFNIAKVRNPESLFAPTPEAMSKVEDVLFSLSRVLLSTDRDIKFYILQATDIQSSMQIVITGYLEDVKRVRYWDISRDEYRKRIVYDLKINPALTWHRPVYDFFKDLGTLSTATLRDKYFGDRVSLTELQNMFSLGTARGPKRAGPVQWKIEEIRNHVRSRNEAVVYVKVRPERKQAAADYRIETDYFEYLFVNRLVEDRVDIEKIIPFQYDQNGFLKRIPFPADFSVEKNIENWDDEFPISEVFLGPFLAQQLTRRVQALAAGDERIRNTFRQLKLRFVYNDEIPPHFELQTDVSLRDRAQAGSVLMHEDMFYLLGLASREFVDVLRSYRFGNYEFLKISVDAESAPWIFGRENLELFRRNKIDMRGLLSITGV